MKICVAPAAFKGSLSALQAASAMAQGVSDAVPFCEIIRVPMADGRQGTAHALVEATGGRYVHETVTNAVGERVEAQYGLLGDGKTAVVDAAVAAGLSLVPADRRNALLTTSFGVGELIRSSLNHGVSKIILTADDLASFDAGAGMAQALGVRFLDSNKVEIGLGGAELKKVHFIDASGIDPRLRHVSIEVASKEDAPWLGKPGAIASSGLDRGSTPHISRILESSYASFAETIQAQMGVRVRDVPGLGAAGGLPVSLVAFCGARLRPGIDIVVDAVNLPEKVAGCELVMTGEGRLDGSSISGKTIAGVGAAASRSKIPVVVLTGSIGPGAERVLEVGVVAYFAIADGPLPLKDGMRNAYQLLQRAAEHVTRLFSLGMPRSGTARTQPEGADV